MTITATQFPARSAVSSADDLSGVGAPAADVSWRALSSSLWVARRDGRHLGTVQRGRRWLASDSESEPIGAFRTFAEAQAAVSGSVPHPTEDRDPVLGPLFVIAGLSTAALASAGVWAWATLLG